MSQNDSSVTKIYKVTQCNIQKIKKFPIYSKMQVLGLQGIAEKSINTLKGFYNHVYLQQTFKLF